MASDESLAAGIRDALAHKNNIEEKKMFCGVGFLLNGKMLVLAASAPIHLTSHRRNERDTVAQSHKILNCEQQCHK